MAIWDYRRLARRLRTGDSDERVSVVTELAEDEDPRAWELLRTAAKDNDKRVRYEATLVLATRMLMSDKLEGRDIGVKALGSVPSERAVQLIWKFQDRVSDDAFTRALSRIGTVAVPFLRRKLGTSESGRVRRAINVLGNIDDDMSRATLADALRDPKTLRIGCLESVITALRRLKYKPKSQHEQILFALERGQVRSVGRLGSKAAPLLAELIQTQRNARSVDYGGITRDAVLAVAELPKALSLSVIRSFMDPRQEIRQMIDVDVVYCRARHGDEQSMAALRDQVDGTSYYFSMPAAIHLAVLGDVSRLRPSRNIPHPQSLHDQVLLTLSRYSELLSDETLQSIAKLDDWQYTEVVDETPPGMCYAGVGMDFPGRSWDVEYQRTWDCAPIREAAAAALMKKRTK